MFQRIASFFQMRSEIVNQIKSYTTLETGLNPCAYRRTRRQALREARDVDELERKQKVIAFIYLRIVFFVLLHLLDFCRRRKRGGGSKSTLNYFRLFCNMGRSSRSIIEIIWYIGLLQLVVSAGCCFVILFF